MDDKNSTCSDEIDSEKERYRIHHEYRTGRNCQCHRARTHNPPNRKEMETRDGKRDNLKSNNDNNGG